MNEQIFLIAKNVIEHNGFFVATIKMIPPKKIQILVDGEGGVSLKSCSEWNRLIREQIEQEITGYQDGNFELEVSSFGIGEPLVDVRQYKINIGRKIKVSYTENETEICHVIGKLMSVNDGDIEVENKVGKGKKAIVGIKKIFLNKIKKTIIDIDF